MNGKIAFRDLKANEVECRIGSVSKKGTGLSLLLYKDARCDMNILDETVGAENWQRRHYECKGNLFCEVAILAENGEWVKKSDCGVESYTEKEKGEASDSFKRACVNWGIGRELYTSPYIWIPKEKCNIENDKGKFVCYDSFEVESIKIENKVITALSIKNTKTKKVVFSFPTSRKGNQETQSSTPECEVDNWRSEYIRICNEKKINATEYAASHGINKNTTQEQYRAICEELLA